MPADDLTLAFTGDLVLDEPDGPYWLAGIAPVLKAADLAIGHLEVPHTESFMEAGGDIPAPGAPPENLAAIADAGFGMVSLAGNHMADCGAQGIADTIAGLDALEVAHAGAGPDLASARTPAIRTVKGRRIALLSYNCVGPEAGWADEGRPGCAYLPITTADGSPVNPRAPLEGVPPQALAILKEDIGNAREQADLLLVAMHKGIVHTPATLAPYERDIARAAVDFGADAVIGHHAHIARGIEFHRGRPIFHGMGNGCVVTRALAPDQDHPGRREWAQRRKEMFGFEPDPAYTLAPFHPEATNAFIGQLTLGGDGGLRASIVPVFIAPPGRPELPDAEKAASIRHYLVRITEGGGMPPITISDAGLVEAAA